jgi:multiple antibiotic resistance protein
MWAERLSEFVTLFVVVNPVGALPVLLAVAGSQSPAQQRKIALQAVIVAFVTLVFFIFGGRFLLTQMGIAVRAFQISGGIVLFVLGLAMIQSDISVPAQDPNPASVAVFPLGIPKLAGPGAMLAVVLLTDDDRANLVEQGMVIGVLALVMIASLIILLLAVPVSRRIGKTGASVVGRLMGVFLSALAVNTVLTALGGWLGLPQL